MRVSADRAFEELCSLVFGLRREVIDRFEFEERALRFMNPEQFRIFRKLPDEFLSAEDQRALIRRFVFNRLATVKVADPKPTS